MSTESPMPMQAMPGEMMQSMRGDMRHGGHLYMQTNELRNAVVHYHQSANGTIEEVDRVSTGGAGSGEFKPVSGQESAPNAFEGAGSVILSPDRRFLFTTSRPTGATTPSRASPSVTTGGSRCSTAARRATRSRDGAAPPSRWRMRPKRARSTCFTGSLLMTGKPTSSL